MQATVIPRDMANSDQLTFPDKFLWGASTSHFQIEGCPSEMQSKLSDWSVWMSEPGRILDGTTAEAACQFISRYQKDIDLLRSMNLNAFRFSFNWPSLFPEEPGTGVIKRKLNSAVVEFYRSLIDDLKQSGIKSFATLFHFCLPTWLHDEGGWTSPRAASEFRAFVELIAEEFGDAVDYWITINEPLAYVYQSYVAGLWTPGHKGDYLSAFTAVRNMLTGHALAYAVLKAKNDNPIGFANHWRPFAPENLLNPMDHSVCAVRDAVFNHLFPSSIKNGFYRLPGPLRMFKEMRALEGEIEGLEGSEDYLGVNYYTRDMSRFKPGWPIDLFGQSSTRRDLKTNSLGWEVYPEGLFRVLTRELKPYSIGRDGKEKDVIITENGFAQTFKDSLSTGDWSLDDEDRIQYLVAHLKEVHRAIKQGVKVKGYLHWSLLDNFEWSEGLSPRFGLVRVSYPTQERTLRQSASVYSKIAQLNAVPFDVKL